jgi:hypothetical protein
LLLNSLDCQKLFISLTFGSNRHLLLVVFSRKQMLFESFIFLDRFFRVAEDPILSVSNQALEDSIHHFGRTLQQNFIIE